MTREEQGALGALLAVTAEYFGRPLHNHVIALYIGDLQDLPFEEVYRAIHELRRQTGRQRMFLPPEIRGRVHPEDIGPSAEEIAAAAWGAISRCGRDQPDKARARIGEIGWQAVEMLGGWYRICVDTKTDDKPTFIAQFRECCRGIKSRTPSSEKLLTQRDAINSVRALTAGIGRVID